jgi:RNA recognition motif-containing protein
VEKDPFALKTLFVGNLPFSSTQDEITELFAQFGTVTNVTMITHKESGRPKGFCFVEMEEQGAQEAINGLNDSEFGGRQIKVEFRHRDTEQRGGDGRYNRPRSGHQGR